MQQINENNHSVCFIRLNDQVVVQTKSGKHYTGRVVSLKFDWLNYEVVYMALAIEENGNTKLFHYRNDRGMVIVSPEKPTLPDIPKPIINPTLQSPPTVEPELAPDVLELIDTICLLAEDETILEYVVNKKPALWQRMSDCLRIKYS
jgi:hypothetical protein